MSATVSYANPNCHYGDHTYTDGGGVCSGCGHRLRCYCGAFVRVDSIDKHLETCRLVARLAESAS